MRTDLAWGDYLLNLTLTAGTGRPGARLEIPLSRRVCAQRPPDRQEEVRLDGGKRGTPLTTACVVARYLSVVGDKARLDFCLS